MTTSAFVLAFLLSLMFSSAWKIYIFVIVRVLLPVLKWTMFIGAIVGFTCSDQFYKAFGFSGISIFVGPGIHNNVAKRGHNVSGR